METDARLSAGRWKTQADKTGCSPEWLPGGSEPGDFQAAHKLYQDKNLDIGDISCVLSQGSTTMK